jgi:deoxyxylulose-5-phosphate synthase
MGALANGIAAHGGLIPLAVTYLPFSDYERPAMRMAALMGVPSIFVFSHDSIGIGKNGPTHQPVEILASLRAMPNMWCCAPATRWRRRRPGRSRSTAKGADSADLRPPERADSCGATGARRTARRAAPMCWPRPRAARGA